MDHCAFCPIPDVAILMDVQPIDVVVFEPLNPVVTGHVLVVPRLHVSDFAESTSVSAEVMYAAAVYVQQIGGGDWNLITSKGSPATQSVFHLHLHLIPRFPGDGLMMPWTGQVTNARNVAGQA